jgi:hypothetical protein
VFDRRAETVVREVKVDKRATHEDSGGVNLLVESIFAIDEENVNALRREQASTLKSCQSRTDNSHVVTASHEYFAKFFVSQSSRLAACYVPSATPVKFFVL